MPRLNEQNKQWVVCSGDFRNLFVYDTQAQAEQEAMALSEETRKSYFVLEPICRFGLPDSRPVRNELLVNDMVDAPNEVAVEEPPRRAAVNQFIGFDDED